MPYVKITSLNGEKVNKSVSESKLKQLGFNVEEAKRTGRLPVSVAEYDKMSRARKDAPDPTPIRNEYGITGYTEKAPAPIRLAPQPSPVTNAPPLPGVLNLQLASGQPVTWNGNTYHPNGTVTPTGPTERFVTPTGLASTLANIPNVVKEDRPPVAPLGNLSNDVVNRPYVPPPTVTAPNPVLPTPVAPVAPVAPSAPVLPNLPALASPVSPGPSAGLVNTLTQNVSVSPYAPLKSAVTTLPAINTSTGTTDGLIRQLMDASLKAGTNNAQQMTPVLDNLTKTMNTFNTAFTEDRARQAGLVDTLLGKSNEIMDYFNSQRDTSTGLSPETNAALRTMALEEVPARFEKAGEDLRTTLLRSGGMGAGMPSGGDVIRGFAPLITGREQTRAGLLRDTILANEAEKRRTLDVNRDRALSTLPTAAGLVGTVGSIFDPAKYQPGLTSTLAGMTDLMKTQADTQMQGLGLASQLVGQSAQLDLAKMDVNLRRELEQMGITSNEKLAQLDANTRTAIANLDATTRMRLGDQDAATRLSLGQLDANTRLTLGNLDAETQKWTSQLSADTQTKLADLARTNQLDITKLDADTRIKVAEISAAATESAGRLAPLLIGSALSNLMAGGKESILFEGIGGLINILKGKPGPGDAEEVGNSVGGSIGSTIKDFFKNPVTIGIGGALAVGAMWLKSQAHWEANTMVQKFENPFHYDYLAPFVSEFTKSLSSGQLTQGDIVKAREGFVANWDAYVAKAREYGKRGSDEKKVSEQSINNLWPLIQNIVGTIDSAAQSVAA